MIPANVPTTSGTLTPRRATFVRGVLLASIATLSIGVGCSRQVPERPAGVILVSIDTLRADHLNCYGYTARPVSPSIDALASYGILFKEAIAAAPWTTPSHMSMMTSVSPTEHQVLAIAQEINNALKLGGGYPVLSPSIKTLPEALKGAGWVTGAFTGGRTVDPRLGFGRGFDSYDVSMDKLGPRKVTMVLDWLSARKGEKEPFFLFWHTFEVHAPYMRGRFLDSVVPPDSAAAMRRDLLKMLRKRGRKRLGPGIALLDRHDAYTAKVCTALYDGGIRWVDDAIGQMVARLRDLGLYDRVMIVVTSDHGEQLGEHNGLFFNAHGHTLYDDLIHVPLIVKLPGQRHAGVAVSGIVRHIDVMPTILDVAGVQGPPMRGVSLRPFWEGHGSSLVAISEAMNGPYEEKALRTETAKYIIRMNEAWVSRHGRAVLPEHPDRRELYDLVADPGETANRLVKATPEAGRLAQEMDRRLRRMLPRPGHASEAHPDRDLVDGLKELGYLDQ